MKLGERINAASAPTSGRKLGAIVREAELKTTKTPETQIASPASGIVKQPTMAQLQQQRQQAQVDLDVNRVNELDKQMKAMRAQAGQQTFADRVGDVLSGATSASGGNLVNAAGTGLGLINEGIALFEGQDKDKARVKMEQTAEILRTGYLTDGRPVTDAMRKTLEQQLKAYQEQYEATPAPVAFEEKHPGLKAAEQSLYQTADTLQETSREQVASAKEGLGAAGQFAVDAGVGAAQLAAPMVLGAINPALGTAWLGLQSFGGAAQEARQSGADVSQQAAYGLTSAAASILTERLANVAGPFKKAFGGGMLDKALSKVTTKPAGKLILSALSEGGEEMLESAMQPVLQRLTYDPEAAYDSEWLAETLYSGAVGAVLGGLGGGVDVIGNPKANTTPKNHTTTKKLSMEDFTNPQSAVWNNVDINDIEVQTKAMQTMHEEMLNEGSVVKVSDETESMVDGFYPDLRNIKKEERTPMLKQKMTELKKGLRSFLTGIKNGSYEFEVNGNVLEAKLYDTGVREVMANVTQPKAKMLYHSDEIFKNAKYLYSLPDSESDPNIYRWNYFYTPVDIGGDIVGVRIAVRDVANPAESQIYNWNIKKDATVGGDGRGENPRISSNASLVTPKGATAPNENVTQAAQTVKDPFDIVPNIAEMLKPEVKEKPVQSSEKDPFDIVPKLDQMLGKTAENRVTPETLPTKARNKLQKTERKLVNQIGNVMSVPYTAKRDYLQGVVREMSTEYLATGKVSRETMDRLFETAYEQGIVVDTEYYDQYKELKDELRTRPVAISDEDKADIADYNDFRKSTMGTLLISNSGTPVDILYEELAERYRELFPASIYAPSDQLKRMFEVGKSIQKVEHTLDSYYGEHADTFKAFAKREFEDAATSAIQGFKEVRRWTEEQIEKRARQMAYTPDMLKNAYVNIRRARKAREKALSQELLTDSDKALLKRLEAGEITVNDLKPGRDNVRGIRKVYEASQEYNQWNRVIKEYKKELNQKRRAEADAELGTMVGWKDKPAGILYSRETMERNLRDIAPDKETADRIYNKYFKPVHDSNAAATRAKNDFRNRVRKLNLNRKPTNGNKVSEAYAVQFIGEAEDNIRMLEESTERNAKRDGMTLQEWKTEVENFWRENPNMDKAKINESVQEFRSIYDELFQKMNEVRVRNGYEPVAYRKGYFPHFQEGESGLLTSFGQALGITTDVTNLPTSINGLTHTFRPGITWFGHAQERKGFKTDYDAVKGFDKYIEGAADVIYQTDNIQNLRALAHQIRYNTTDDGIKAQVDNVRANENLNEDQKYNEIEKIYEDGQFALSNFVVELEEYTNLLANKKSRADRNMESLIGRQAYNVVKGLERRVAANMVAINPSSWLTNFIPITQGMASLDTQSLLQGMWDTLKAYKEPDGMVEVSSFLTNRRGSDPIAKTWAQETSAVLSKPMEWIDSFTADTLVRARYNQNVKNGMSEVDALNEADKWAAGVMADRSKGSMPTLFERSNPLTKLFTQFQLEVNNQYSFLFKDLPDDLKKKGAAAMTAALLKMFMGAWLYNEVYEHLIGRRPALDPLGILNDTVGDFTGYELPNMVDLAGEAISGDLGAEDFQTEKTGTYEAITNAGGQIVEQLPFIGGLAGGGRLPISSALPNVQNLGKALFSDDWAPEKKWATIGKELSAPLLYIAPPAGGGMLKKWVQNIKAGKEGGSYSVNSKGEKLLQYPIYTETGGDVAQNVLTMGLFGKSALPQAQDWVESGFDSLGAKETHVYQGLTETGVGQREAFQFLQDFGKVEKTETESADTRKRRVLKDSDLSDEAKSMVFYGLLANDTEQETLDRMEEADFSGAAAAMMNLKDADLLKGTTATKAERAAIMNANVSDRAKMILYTEYVSDSKQDEIETVLDAGLTFDDWLTFEYRTAGLGSDQSQTKKEKVMDVIQNMNITPEQKDALYLTGYEASGLKDAPWRKGLTVPQIGATIFELPKLELPELKIPKLW